MLPCPSIVQNVLAADLKGLWKKKINIMQHTLLWLESNTKPSQSATAQEKILECISRGRSFQNEAVKK